MKHLRPITIQGPHSMPASLMFVRRGAERSHPRFAAIEPLRRRAVALGESMLLAIGHYYLAGGCQRTGWHVDR